MSFLLLPIGDSLYEAETLSKYGCVWVADTDPRCTGMRLPNHVWLPPFSEPDCLARLLEACQTHQINGIYPAAEIAYDWLMNRRPFIESKGINVVMSSNEAINLCRDKYVLARHLQHHGIRTPETVLLPASAQTTDFKYPLLLKNRDSTGQRFAYQRLDEPADLNYWRRKGLNAVVQPYLEGLPEISLQMIVGWDGKLKLYVPLLHEASGRRGMTWVFRSIVDDRIEALCQKIVRAFPGLVGPINVDLFQSRDGLIVLDINTRFSEYAIGAVLATDCGTSWPPLYAEMMFLLAERAAVRANNLGTYNFVRIQSTVQRYASNVA